MMLDFSSSLLREVHQAQDAEMLGRAGDPQGPEDRRSLVLFTLGVNVQGRQEPPGLLSRALALVRLAPKVTQSWHDEPPHKCVLECSQHSLSSHRIIPVLKSSSTCRVLDEPLSPRD